ncbi:MAG: hypothetical protein IJ192_10670 [Clostridia bacterium]|nr:hypothetical protein [Clostridia bacterium]
MLESMNLSRRIKKSIKYYISSYKKYNKEGNIEKRDRMENEYNGYIKALHEAEIINYKQWNFLFKIMFRVWERHVIHELVDII